MGMLLGAVGALSTFYPDAKNIADPESRYLQRVRLIAKLPTIAAFVFRHSRGPAVRLPAQRPRLHRQLRQHDVRDRRPARAEPGARSARSRSCSSCTPTTSRTARRARCAASARRTSIRSRPSRPASRRSTARCTAARTRRCCGCSTRSATTKNVPAFIESVKARQGPADGLRPPRLQELRPAREADQDRSPTRCSSRPGSNPKLEIALELERIALEDDYFVSRKLYPNVDFYSGLIYQAMGFPTDYFTVLFALGRLPGWIAQWEEMLNDPEQKIARPRQIYVGHGRARRSCRWPSAERHCARATSGSDPDGAMLTAAAGSGCGGTCPARAPAPPSTVSVSPVMCAGIVGEQEERARDDVLERREAALRDVGQHPLADLLASGRGARPRPRCRAGPGAMQLTRMPSGAHSTASERVRFQTPALAAAECAVIGLPVQA